MFKWINNFRIQKLRIKVFLLEDDLTDLQLKAVCSNLITDLAEYEAAVVKVHNLKVKLRKLENNNE